VALTIGRSDLKGDAASIRPGEGFPVVGVKIHLQPSPSPLNPRLGGITGRLIGMQYYAETAPLLGVTAPTAAQFAAYLVAFGDAQGDTVRATAAGDAWIVTQTSWRLMEGVAPLHPAVFDAWNALWEGALAVHDRRLALVVERRLDWGDDAFVWRVRPRAPRRS